MHKLAFLRHGQSVWNKENRFTGWTDVDLTEQGIQEARHAGQILKEKKFVFDVVYSNVLRRTIKTAWLVMEEMDLMWAPFYTSWRLNEKHYGALQGLNKAETAQKFGEEKVLAWRRAFDAPPPALNQDDPRHPIHDQKYQHLSPAQLPATESLKSTIDRLLPYWHDTIWPQVEQGLRVLVVASHNSLRGLIMHLDQIPPEQIAHLNIPYGIPLIYELDDQIQPHRHYYLGDEE